jgi:hypothetical protein
MPGAMRGLAPFCRRHKKVRQKSRRSAARGLVFFYYRIFICSPAEGTSCAILGARDIVSRVFLSSLLHRTHSIISFLRDLRVSA